MYTIPMPRFDFECKKCGHAFEATLPFGAATKPTCLACGSKVVEKLIAPPGIVFKGSGWYKTDSRPAPKKETTSEEMKPEAPKKEEKPEKKAEAAKKETERKDASHP